MSRIGKVPVALPGGVTASIEEKVLSVKGPKGTLSMPMLDDISYGIEDERIVVKPANGGSALGIKFARSAEDVPAALVAAFSYDSKVLLERYVEGRDLAVSILDGEPLPVVEAVPRDDATRYLS